MNRKRTTMAGIAIAGLLATAAPATATGGAPPTGRTVSWVDTMNDSRDAYPGDGRCADDAGRCSLRAAVQEANASGAPTQVKLRSVTYVLTITGAGEDGAASGDLDVTGSIDIVGAGATIDLAGFGDRAFDVHPGATLAVSDLTVKNGAPPATESGGAFRSAGTLALDAVIAHGNAVTGTGASGGAVLNRGGDLTVLRSVLRNNTATRAGGAIEADAGTTAIVDSLLHDNVTGPMPGNGGAFHLTGAGTVVVSSSTIRDNVAAAEGGGLWNSATGEMLVERTEISANRADGVAADEGGGGLFNDGGTLVVKDSRISANLATAGSGSGGGILNNLGTLGVWRTTIDGNTAARAGGGIEAVGGSTSLVRTRLVDNTTGPTPGNGGGLHLSGAGTVEVRGSVVARNTAANEGGGLWNSSTGVMHVHRTRIAANVANGDAADEGGGGIFNQGNADGTGGGTLEVTNSRIARNQATVGSASGGGILNEQGTLTVADTRIVANTAARAGGGIEAVGGAAAVDVGSSEVVRSRLVRNVTGPTPGNGGGLHLTGTASVTVTDSRVVANRAANEGGGVWNSPTGTMVVTGTTFARNQVGIAGNGPDVFQKDPVAGGSLTVDGVLVPEGPNTIDAG